MEIFVIFLVRILDILSAVVITHSAYKQSNIIYSDSYYSLQHDILVVELLQNNIGIAVGPVEYHLQ